MGGKSGGDTTTKTEPWSGQQPYLTTGFQQAQNLLNSGGPDYYPNATYVNFSPQSQMAMQLGENRALMGSQFDAPAGNVAMQAMQGNSPFTQAGVGALQAGGLGMGQLADTISGKYLNSNPYVDQMFNAAARGVNEQYQNQVMPGVNATFGSGGRTGSMAHQTGLDMANQSYQNSMTDMAAIIYGNNYANERSNQMNASSAIGNLGQGLASGYGSLGNQNYAQMMGGAALGQQLGQNDWANIGALGQIGQQVEGKAGEMLGDYQNRFNFYQNRPEQNLQNYIASINGIPVNGSTQSTEGGGSSLGNAIGGAAAGAGLASMLWNTPFAGTPWGWGLVGAGALAGLLG